MARIQPEFCLSCNKTTQHVHPDLEPGKPDRCLECGKNIYEQARAMKDQKQQVPPVRWAPTEGQIEASWRRLRAFLSRTEREDNLAVEIGRNSDLHQSLRNILWEHDNKREKRPPRIIGGTPHKVRCIACQHVWPTGQISPPVLCPKCGGRAERFV